MSSIIEGYNYDLFISYRQNDNKYDGWVTEFVDNLNKELEATIKDKISVYFDINPHDGLLETHSVDRSLEEKLKCLIFIPVISQTYCDPKSFAWQNEFCAFNKLAKEDKFGRDIKLSSGNVASRILPIKIHDLEPDDKALLENELGGVLRSIEFIYKSAGVNRPLRANEDHPQDNLNKTYYRDQINKVANAVKEIISALKKQSQHPEEEIEQDSEVNPSRQKNLRTKIIAGFIIALILVVLGFLIIPKLANSEKQFEKSIAVLPFINESPVDSNKYFINGIMEEVLNNLQTIKDFRVLSRTSTNQYQGPDKPTIPEIAKKLNVNYIVEGSGQKYGNIFRLRVQLIRAKGKETHLWGKSYEQEIRGTNDVFNIQSQIAQAIAAELKAAITPEEKQLIERIPTSSKDALYFYQKGKEELGKFISGSTNRRNKQVLITNKQALASAKKMFTKALEYDSTFALAYTGLAREFWDRGNIDSTLILADKALFYNKQLSEAYILRGNYYDSKGEVTRAIDEYDKALKINPNSWEAYYQKGILYRDVDLLQSIDNLQKAAKLNSGPELPDIKYEITRAYNYAGFYEKSKNIALEVLKLDGDSVRYLAMVSMAEFYLGNEEKALKFRKKAYAIDSTNIMSLQQLGESYREMRNWEEMLKYCKKYSLTSGDLSSLHLGYAYLKNGYTKEAEDCFERLTKSYENNIKLNPQSYRTYGYLAILYAIRDDKEKVYESLNRFYQTKALPIHYVKALNYPAFDSIRNEPEFKKITAEMEERFQAENERIRKWLEENNML
jgi:TolB-like protein/Flp pilus assembly protein TadD